jgi:hypothetical protein
MYQKDLVFLNDGNPNNLGQMINFNKRLKMADVVFDITLCQQGSYSHTVTAPQVIPWIWNSSALTDKDLYLWSRRVDPQDPEMVISELISVESECLVRISELQFNLNEEKIKVREMQQEIDSLRAQLAAATAGTALTPTSEKKTLDSTRNTTSPMITEEQRAVQPPKPHRRHQGVLRGAVMNHSVDMDPFKWSVWDVCEWVEGLVGPGWKEPFLANHILGTDLMEMGLQELSIFIEDESVCGVIFIGIGQLKKMKPMRLSQNLNMTSMSNAPGSTSPTYQIPPSSIPLSPTRNLPPVPRQITM